MTIDNVQDLNLNLKLLQKEIKIMLGSLQAQLDSEAKNIKELRPEMNFAYDTQSYYAKILGKQITLSEKRIKRLNGLIWKHKRRQQIVGKLISQTNVMCNDIVPYAIHWDAYWQTVIRKLTYVPDKAFEERIKSIYGVTL